MSYPTFHNEVLPWESSFDEAMPWESPFAAFKPEINITNTPVEMNRVAVPQLSLSMDIPPQQDLPQAFHLTIDEYGRTQLLNNNGIAINHKTTILEPTPSLHQPASSPQSHQPASSPQSHQPASSPQSHQPASSPQPHQQLTLRWPTSEGCPFNGGPVRTEKRPRYTYSTREKQIYAVLCYGTTLKKSRSKIATLWSAQVNDPPYQDDLVRLGKNLDSLRRNEDSVKDLVEAIQLKDLSNEWTEFVQGVLSQVPTDCLNDIGKFYVQQPASSPTTSSAGAQCDGSAPYGTVAPYGLFTTQAITKDPRIALPTLGLSPSSISHNANPDLSSFTQPAITPSSAPPIKRQQIPFTSGQTRVIIILYLTGRTDNPGLRDELASSFLNLYPNLQYTGIRTLAIAMDSRFRYVRKTDPLAVALENTKRQVEDLTGVELQQRAELYIEVLGVLDQAKMLWDDGKWQTMRNGFRNLQFDEGIWNAVKNHWYPDAEGW
jgi:hypothetical protein